MFTIKEELNKLLKLQELDDKIHENEALLKHLPEKLRSFEKEDSIIQKEMEDFKKTSTRIKLERKQKEIELKTAEDQIKSLQSRLYEVKTNKEYQALQMEISSPLEDEILVYMEKDEQLQKTEKELQKKIQTYNEEKSRKKEEIKRKITELQAIKTELENQRKQLVDGIDRLLIELYDRIKKMEWE